MKKIILASQSPRRRELMQLIGLEYEVIPSGCEENCVYTKPEDYVIALSQIKAEDVVKKTNGDRIVIGADTIVVHNEEILGKPKDKDDAFRILKSLSGDKHDVYTGITIIDGLTGRSHSFSEKTCVEFYDISDKEVNDYIETGDPFDKAGGYGIQSKGAFLVKAVYGDFYNVVGLPVARLFRELKQFL